MKLPKNLKLASLLGAITVFPPAGIEGKIELEGNIISYELEENSGSYSLPDSVNLISGAWQNIEAPYESALINFGYMNPEDAGKLDLLVCSDNGVIFVLPWRDNRVADPVRYEDYFVFIRETFNNMLETSDGYHP